MNKYYVVYIKKSVAIDSVGTECAYVSTREDMDREAGIRVITTELEDYGRYTVIILSWRLLKSWAPWNAKLKTVKT